MAIFKKSQPKKDAPAKLEDKKIEIKVSNSPSAGRSEPSARQSPPSAGRSEPSARQSLQEAMKIKHPWITEKVGHLIDLGKYAFLVDKKINKPQIAKAIESIYRVKVLSVNIINKKEKIKSLGRSKGKVPGHKKAIVTLKKGHKIDVMPT